MMTSVGETLRRERLKRHLNLEQISRETKISPRLLEAIEAEQFEKLPGGVFARSFVRQYARVLGLDEDDLVQEFDRMMEPPAPVEEPAATKPDGRIALPKFEIPVPKVEEWQWVRDGGRRWTSSLPALAGVVVVMVFCSMLYSWWQRSRNRTVAAEPVAPMARTAPPVAPGPPPAVSSADRMEQSPSAPADSTPATRSESPAVAASVPASATAGVRLQLMASEPSWISVREDGRVLFSGTLEATETRAIEAAGPLLLRLGNAGGVAITVNGQALGPAGQRGEVRTVHVTPNGFQPITPEAAAPERKPEPVYDPLL